MAKTSWICLLVCLRASRITWWLSTTSSRTVWLRTPTTKRCSSSSCYSSRCSWNRARSSRAHRSNWPSLIISSNPCRDSSCIRQILMAVRLFQYKSWHLCLSEANPFSQLLNRYRRNLQFKTKTWSSNSTWCKCVNFRTSRSLRAPSPKLNTPSSSQDRLPNLQRTSDTGPIILMK